MINILESDWIALAVVFGPPLVGAVIALLQHKFAGSHAPVERQQPPPLDRTRTDYYPTGRREPRVV